MDIRVNRQVHHVEAAADTPLLYVLREDLQLNAAKYGCGLGQCGACTVLLDGKPVFSCRTPLSVVQGREVTTVEGLGSQAAPAAIQQAFEHEQAAQCGYCIPGIMMRAHALLTRDPHVSDDAIRAALQPHLCRCGTHMRILRAVRRAADVLVA